MANDMPEPVFERPFANLSDEELIAKRSELVDLHLVQGLGKDAREKAQTDLLCVQAELYWRYMADQSMEIFGAHSVVRQYYLDDNHEVKPIKSREEWIIHQIQSMNLERYHRVGLDEVKGCRISTVFLGVGATEMLGFFETMAFGLDDDLQWRYMTWERAERGHKIICAAIKESRSREEALHMIEGRL